MNHDVQPKKPQAPPRHLTRGGAEYEEVRPDVWHVRDDAAEGLVFVQRIERWLCTVCGDGQCEHVQGARDDRNRRLQPPVEPKRSRAPRIVIEDEPPVATAEEVLFETLGTRRKPRPVAVADASVRRFVAGSEAA